MSGTLTRDVGGSRLVASGAFTSTTTGIAFPGVVGDRNVTISGTFVATIVPERSFDDGATWFPVTYIDGSAISWTAPCSTPLPEAEPGVWLRLKCTFTSGTVNWRLSQ